MIENPDAIAPVRAQLDAYNRRDLETFLAQWSVDCELYAFPDTLIAKGKTAMRARYAERFRERHLMGTLNARLCVGDIVVDHETVRRTLDGVACTMAFVGIYKVENGKITKAWVHTSTPQPVED